MLKRGRPPVTKPHCSCGEADPENFGTCLSRCLSCRRDDDAKRRAREKQPRDFQQALETLKIINSFPPTTGANTP
jgi:hypothetical protein